MDNSTRRELLHISAVDLLGCLTAVELEAVICAIISILSER